MKRSGFSTIRTLGSSEPIPAGQPRRYRDGRGYIRLRWKVGTKQYVEEYEHRIVAGRPPEPMHVHHINGVKDDNSPENLQVLTPAEHQRVHADSREYRRRESRAGAFWPYRGRQAMEKAERRAVVERIRSEEVDLMRDLYESGLTLPEVAEAVGVDHSNVYRRLAKAGVQFRSKSDYAAKVDGAELASRYEAGRSIQSLAVEYRITGDRVRKILDEQGTTIRRPGRPRAHGRMEENAARLSVRKRSGGICEICGIAKAAEWHHRKNRSQGGPWSASNGLDLCSKDHRWVTEHPEEACENGWSVKSWDDETEIPVLTAAYGVVLLDDEGGWKSVGSNALPHAGHDYAHPGGMG